MHYLDIFPDIHATLDVDPVAPIHPQGYPVIVHSHGWEGHAGNSAFMMRHFASHGWVAVAPDHTGNTLTDNLDPFPSQFDYLRSFDIRESLNLLERLNQEDMMPGEQEPANLTKVGD